MRKLIRLGVLALALAFAAGCASIPESLMARGQKPLPELPAPKGEVGTEDGGWKKRDDTAGAANNSAGQKVRGENGKNDKCPDNGPPRTLFEWAIGPEVPDEPEGEDTIVTDRPDFTEASSTVGLGRVQLEAGYTYFRDRSGGATLTTQTYPEALLRIGAFADWFELRLGLTYVHSPITPFAHRVEHDTGLSDLYVGSKLWLTEQKGHLPEMALVLQALVPTGAEALTADRVLPGFNFLYGWDVIPDKLTAGGSLGANRAVDDDGHSFVVLTQSFTLGYTLTEQLGAYTEWFALYPTGATAADTTPEHYFNGGFTFKVTPDFQLDIRAGVGLNEHAQDFFTGAGFAVRY